MEWEDACYSEKTFQYRTGLLFIHSNESTPLETFVLSCPSIRNLWRWICITESHLLNSVQQKMHCALSYPVHLYWVDYKVASAFGENKQGSFDITFTTNFWSGSVSLRHFLLKVKASRRYFMQKLLSTHHNSLALSSLHHVCNHYQKTLICTLEGMLLLDF